MSNHQTLVKFLTQKRFVIPKYQRSYAWDRTNIQELIGDIQEAIESKSSHYVGTIVLAKTDQPNVFHVVDGQQRLTSLMLLINVLVESVEDKMEREINRRKYLVEKGQYKLTPHARDVAFFHSVLRGDLDVEPASRGQRFLQDADDEVRNLVAQIESDPQLFLDAIGELWVLEFIEEDEGNAIRIFQTVNDRGKELSRMDKIKSLLFYFSNKHLDGELDDRINDTFGDIFEAYDDIKQTAEGERFPYLSTNKFSEDDLLRHHHICYSEQSYDPAAQHVLAEVKNHLTVFRKDHDTGAIRDYVSRYIDGLHSYVFAFKRLIEGATTANRYYKLFGVLGLSAVFYPVITQLEKLGLLDEVMPKRGVTVLEMAEIIDVRVFKIRDYKGRKHISEFAFSLANKPWSIGEVEERLEWLNRIEISDARFREWLLTGNYFKNTGLLRHVFIDYCERLNGRLFSTDDLKVIMGTNPTIEHILSQTNNFRPRALGFKNNEDFLEHLNLIGNLTLLEKKLNSSVGNADLDVKAGGYSRSRYKMTTLLGSRLSQNSLFTKEDLLKRTSELVEDFAKRWWSE